jgi:DNA-binding MarR family transcriptional regulator
MKLHRTVELAGRIRESANRFITEELEKAGITDIAPPHGSVLACLYQNGPMTMKEIADRIRRTQPTVTVLVDKLHACGYVSRNKSSGDGRSVYIGLTGKGEKFETLFRDISAKLNRKIHRGMSAEEIETLEALLERAAGN